jgi:hypothetical protein
MLPLIEKFMTARRLPTSATSSCDTPHDAAVGAARIATRLVEVTDPIDITG